MKILKGAIIILLGLLILSVTNPAATSSEEYVMKFGLAAPNINLSFWATHYNYFKYEV